MISLAREYESSDVWIFRLGLALALFVGVYFGAKHGGRWLHEYDAENFSKRDHPRDAESQHAFAKEMLAEGYRDTEAFRPMRSHFKEDEISAVPVKPHFVEKNAPIEAGAVAFLALLASGEAARIWARKRQAKRQLRG